MKKQLVEFLKPTAEVGVFLAIFLLLSLGGHIQSYAFSDEQTKPAFYEQLQPLPLWDVWVILTLPVALVSSVFDNVYAFWILMVAYFYLLSCALYWAAGKMAKAKAMQKHAKKNPYFKMGIGMGLMALFTFVVLVLLPLALDVLSALARAVSGT